MSSEVGGHGRFAHVDDPVAVGAAVELTVEDQPVDVVTADPEAERDLRAAEAGIGDMTHQEYCY